MNDIATIAIQFPYFILVLFRIAGMMVMAPLFGSRNIPVRIRVLLSIVISVAIMPIVPTAGLRLPGTVEGMVVVVISEMAIGFILGFVASLVFVGVQVGGHLIGQQMGLTLANVIDPLSNQQVSVVEQIYFFFAITLFILLKGHHLLLAAVVQTFETVPLMGLTYNPEMLWTISDDMFGEIFVVGAKVSAPAVAALMLTSVAMAFIARTVPEMNIFNIGFAIRLGLGLAVSAMTIPGLAHLLSVLFGKVAGNIDTINALMAT